MGAQHLTQQEKAKLYDDMLLRYQRLQEQNSNIIIENHNPSNNENNNQPNNNKKQSNFETAASQPAAASKHFQRFVGKNVSQRYQPIINSKAIRIYLLYILHQTQVETFDSNMKRSNNVCDN